MRARASSDPARSTTTGAVRPATLYFYCTAADYASIMLADAIWVSGGVPVPAAGAPPLPPHHGGFPPGAYGSSSAPAVVRAAYNDFVSQWYGLWAAPPLTHFVAFQIDDGWQPEGHNIRAGTAAQFGWHWVNANNNTTMLRGAGVVAIPAVTVVITDHGPF